MKLTLPVARVVCAVGRLLDERPDEVYGLVICNLSGLASGTVYPILQRMEDNGFVNMELKDVHYLLGLADAHNVTIHSRLLVRTS